MPKQQGLDRMHHCATKMLWFGSWMNGNQSLKATFSVRCMTSEHFILNHIILKSIGHSNSIMITISPTCLYEKNELVCVSVHPCGVFSWEKTPPRLPLQITWPWPPVGRSWPDYRKTKENVNIKLLDLCLFTFYSVHANEFTWHWL